MRATSAAEAYIEGVASRIWLILRIGPKYKPGGEYHAGERPGGTNVQIRFRGIIYNTTLAREIYVSSVAGRLAQRTKGR